MKQIDEFSKTVPVFFISRSSLEGKRWDNFWAHTKAYSPGDHARKAKEVKGSTREPDFDRILLLKNSGKMGDREFMEAGAKVCPHCRGNKVKIGKISQFKKESWHFGTKNRVQGVLS